MKANGLMNEGDKIALMVPIFTPYLDIPKLPRYNFDVTYIYASEMNDKGRHTWQYPKEELDKLKDQSIKCLCVVNPSNPPSVAINEEGMYYLPVSSNHAIVSSLNFLGINNRRNFPPLVYKSK